MSEAILEADNGLKYRLETVLRNKKRLQELREKKSRDRRLAQGIDKAKAAFKTKFKKPEELVRCYRRRQKNYADYKFRKNKKACLNSGSGNVLLVLRINGQSQLSKPQKTILNRMGLKKIHECHFFQNDEQTKEDLKKVENQVMFGEVASKVARDLISKRTFISTANGVVAATSNKVVEDTLGKYNIVSLDDVQYELLMGGKNFAIVKEHIKAYKITKPTDGYGDKTKPAIQGGGTWGYHKEGFSELIAKMI